MTNKPDSQKKQPRHARYIEPGQVHHIIAKTLGGKFYLAPHAGVRTVCTGVVAQAREKYPHLKLYSIAILSNHLHMMVSGPSGADVSAFVGFILKEISCRISKIHKRSGPIWLPRFISTALPTPDSQEKCFRYILSQGVKEDLVEDPRHWPGLHIAKYWTAGKPIEGEWLNSTEHTRALQRASRAKKAIRVNIADFIQKVELNFDPLPAWTDRPFGENRIHVLKVIEEIVAENIARRQRVGTKILGRRRVVRMQIETTTELPKPPWWKNKARQLTAWAARRAVETINYVKQYWLFQSQYRTASEEYRAGNTDVVFPPGAWKPHIHVAELPTKSA